MPLRSLPPALAILAASALAAGARDNIQIAGSSTVLPFATIVAEAFGENFGFPTPVVEGGGSGAGRKKLCEGLGESTIDIANSSSRITRGDLELCAANGVTEVIEVQFGHDGIVFASAIDGPDFAFTAAHWYDALGARVMKDGQLVANPNRSWRDVDPALPDLPILAFIPGTKHGTREVFDLKVIEAGCRATGAEAALHAAGEEHGCTRLRTDGLSVDIDGDYTETLSRLDANPTAIGVFGLSFYENNTDRLRVASFDGILPSAETISAGTYPVSRPLWFYVKKAHLGVIPGLREFVEFFLSDDMAGPGGLLSDYGLVPDPALAETRASFAAGTPVGAPD